MSIRPGFTLGSLALAAFAWVGCSEGGEPTRPLADHTPVACDHDILAPTISSVSASPNTLWPPNHKMVRVNVAVSASDNCSAVTSRITSVTSNEPVNGRGDGNTAPDWIVTGPLTLLLRSERAGPGTGRIYTITVQSSDASGNVSTATTTVVVPHDQRKKP